MARNWILLEIWRSIQIMKRLNMLPFSRGIRQGVVCLISGHIHFVVDLTSAFTGHWARHLGNGPSLCQWPDQHTWYSRCVYDHLSWTLRWKMRWRGSKGQSHSNSWNTLTVVKIYLQWKSTTTIYYHYSNIMYKVQMNSRKAWTSNE